jgi:hypothetical protein
MYCSIYRDEEYMKQGTNKKQATAFAGFLCGIHFNPEDGGSMCLKMSVDFYQTTQCSILDDITLHSHYCENSNPTL